MAAGEIGPPPVVLSVAAQDPLGGAGTAADLTTFAALGVHGVSVVTALTAQSIGSVLRIQATDPGFVGEQLEGILGVLAPCAVKTGLIVSAETVEVLAAFIDEGRLPQPVVDPVLVNGRGERFAAAEVERAYRSELIPRALVVTPNVHEAAILVGRELESVSAVVSAADDLAALGAQWVVVTGGRWDDSSDVVIGPDGFVEVLQGRQVDTGHVRGSGCSFAAATAAGLAHGRNPLQAVGEAKRFVAERLAATPDWACGSGGPVAHWL